MKRVTLVAVLSLGLLGLSPIGAADSATSPVTVSAPTQVLKDGCTSYQYAYRVNVDTAEYNWLLQVQITDTAGTRQAFQFFTSGDPGDPTSGTSTFQLCSANVRAPGIFTISGEFDLDNGRTQTAIPYTPVQFQILAAPAKHKAAQHKKKHHKRATARH